MNHTLSKADVDRRSEHINPTSPLYYRDRGYPPRSAVELAALAQRRFQIEASYQKHMHRRERE